MTQLVLLSGWGIDTRLWQRLAPYWPAHLSVSHPDWPGYGQRPGLANPTDLDALAQAMRDSLPADAIWVGWSLGGMLAGALLDHLPAPRALIMLGAVPRFVNDDRGGVSSQEIATFRRAFSRDPQRTWQHFLRWQASGEPSPRHARHCLDALLGDRLPADTATLAGGLEQLARLDLHDTLDRATCPVIYLHGASDPLVPAMARYHPAIALPDCGHCPQLSAPAELARKLARLVDAFGVGRSTAEAIHAS
ncbi:alpha/beta fold hydrolase [Modicisalibacter xianhensis]|uniref:Pimeloyl-[acyl-carrier protein] methyl ester esterase n=1 Tax=Modicisalibacter xianhensis TaxID=442341 RepID=A0A1I3BS27_9GAMM|nr:alpha/beta fold hydrolase [Halomonas xianhensis]SFH64571.1 pimeloyl-[acyl-carrier protein] methyl ester esterase [Halomonas xianhensis]